ncbi:EAL domain-containing protein [Bradyrhizobium sp. G127]|jgi:diguanylate cyclase (GGDEF)-like protein/PAS domain S-box-containing protein|uniref:sensor domain-containing protein n=1 Tax=Bradyrhizobium sp. G127 TaxID=2904800 RepID=UPI001F19A87B|nr:EAL domain-containing protein [Bradyrhizobium sp. G127]MCF2522107.1 EAL domain-containing protein [Bradyrhizobium sp. G127]
MTGWQKQAHTTTVSLGRIAGSFCVSAMACGSASAQIIANPDGTFSALSSDSAHTALMWQVAIGGFVVIAFLAAMVLWISTALRRARHANIRRAAFVSSALNNLANGIVMVDARKRMVFCNDRYLEMYGLDRFDLFPGMTGRDLLELRKQRGTISGEIDDYFCNVQHPDGYVCELKDGRSILIKHRKLANGGIVSTHEDCTEQRSLSKELAKNKNFLESVIDNIPVCVAAKSIEDGKYILANRAFEQFAGISRDQIIGKTAHSVYSPEAAQAVVDMDRDAVVSPTGQTRTELLIDHRGGKRLVACNRVIARNEKNEPEFLVALFEDVTDRRSLSREIQSAKKFLELVVDNIPVALVVKRLSDGQYVLANRTAEVTLGRRREEVVGSTLEDIYNPADVKFILKRDEDAVRKQGVVTEEHPIQTPNGLRLFLTRRVTVLDENGEPQYLIKTNEDVTDRRETESRMAHMAYHDSLTDLPNRAAFLKALSQMIEACKDTTEEFAVLSIDLDRLKEINDVFGHEVGDKLLIEVSRRLETAVQGGVVARLSGDEFGLIIDGVQPDAALELANRLIETMRDEIVIEGRSLRMGLTTGISIFPRNGGTAAELLANADAALFRAKAKSRGSVSFFAAEMDQQVRDRRALHQDLSTAIRNGELSLHYQPQARARHKINADHVLGFEALARWVHPVRGFVPPSDFIPLAEESGLIVEMGEWILREACREAASWPKDLQISVNLSPAQFMHGDLVGLVHSILIETGLAPGRLELEITEGVLIEDFDRGLSLLRRLKALGVRIAMDDFGSGYSSLTYLQSFPFDKIKIDRAFVMNLGRNTQSAAIIRAMIGLGHGLNISIVAEGVETQEQLSFLADEACDQVQGYFLGKPAPIDHYADWIGRDKRVASIPRKVVSTRA